MYRKILIAYNGTSESRSALQECIRLAPDPSAEIHLLAVVNPPPSVVIGEYAMVAMVGIEEEILAEKKKMQEELSSGQLYLREAGVHVRTHIEVGEPVPTIAELVDKLGIELVIVGHSRHQSLAMRWWRGSTDALLVEKIRCSLLVATDPKPDEKKTE
jgi:nucleotide-binding universal stress UspA family protein